MRRIALVVLIFIVLSGCARSRENKEGKMVNIRHAEFAGSWYPGDPDSLRQMLEYFFNAADIKPVTERIVGIISPHAGYIYSGPVAAYAYKQLMIQKDKYKGNTAIILGFRHRPTPWQGVSIWADGYWETPLGKIAVDSVLAEKIIKASNGKIVAKKDQFYDEHSLELQIPFLQYALENEFKIVPITFAHQNQTEIQTLIDALVNANIDWDKTFMVVSTDMSHYHPYNEAVSIDKKTLDYVLSLDVDGFISWLRQGVDAFCGWGGVITLMTVAKAAGATKAVLLRYANSGDTQPGTRSHGVVGYCSVVFVKPGSKGSEENFEEEFSLTKEQKLYLLKLARKTIEEYILRGKVYEPPEPKDQILKNDAAVFVTIHRKGMLRGCIGQMMAQEPLYLAVRDMAISAATKDPRFRPIQPEEIDEIDIEISVLSPLKRVKSYEDIVPFKHGVYITRGWHSGVFLPQVWGQIPDKDAFLSELCVQKAHMEPDCYKKPDTKIYVFTVLEFDEKKFGLK